MIISSNILQSKFQNMPMQHPMNIQTMFVTGEFCDCVRLHLRCCVKHKQIKIIIFKIDTALNSSRLVAVLFCCSHWWLNIYRLFSYSVYAICYFDINKNHSVQIASNMFCVFFSVALKKMKENIYFALHFSHDIVSSRVPRKL